MRRSRQLITAVTLTLYLAQSLFGLAVHHWSFHLDHSPDACCAPASNTGLSVSNERAPTHSREVHRHSNSVCRANCCEISLVACGVDDHVGDDDAARTPTACNVSPHENSATPEQDSHDSANCWVCSLISLSAAADSSPKIDLSEFVHDKHQIIYDAVTGRVPLRDCAARAPPQSV